MGKSRFSTNCGDYIAGALPIGMGKSFELIPAVATAQPGAMVTLRPDLSNASSLTEQTSAELGS